MQHPTQELHKYFINFEKNPKVYKKNLNKIK